MAYEVSRHPLVRDDLFNITILIGEYAGYAIAESKIEQIEKKLNSLTDFPYIGTTRDDIYPGLRAIPAAEKAVICFTRQRTDRDR
ncbi:type II toxin-antitoxin system RelE/ParE family toxin [Rhizobium leucaenae]|jgi:toxin ParE1/3/4|uniref:Plasmid stabilization system protein ParE n=1 Tax=Rhizobium leucaenae TaxID=29450 RepID=A0A7W7EK70_9HYPH|nr:type II toxin-antitoxin system RelE/ParE family toxin [Rhizobium leucaenae]MBB4568530.1 plasmid stabilization system protein ParE [Rhizobium leucaenae]MBB6300310.1 plasmid stabilization system protein ParE [Rhizobium leucaenae]